LAGVAASFAPASKGSIVAFVSHVASDAQSS
jgi:hypothetical protein